jgi:hypothetical protein
MADIVLDEQARTLSAAAELLEQGSTRAAIEVLTAANRVERSAVVERALVRARHDGVASLPAPVPPAGRQPIVSDGGSGGLVEVAAADLDVEVVRAGFARGGCVLVRGLVPPERVPGLVHGVDATFDAYDAWASGNGPAPQDWFDPFPMPDQISPASAGRAVTVVPGAPEASVIPVRRHRRVSREAAGVWAVDSPRMLFDLFELFDEVGLGSLMTEYFGERPFLSANKCNVRRVPAVEMAGGWHQDGAFLGEDVGAFNCWIALTRCGTDAPGLDLVPRRFDRLLEAGSSGAYFKWSLSDEDVLGASDGVGIVRPEFEAGDALLFDHRLAHRTATSPTMTLERHAIEAWFFAPSAFPPSQLPIVY